MRIKKYTPEWYDMMFKRVSDNYERNAELLRKEAERELTVNSRRRHNHNVAKG